mgnify:CR=1 FL=1
MFSFNPCKGFGGFGTTLIVRVAVIPNVSIPVRVLGVLERFTYLPVSIFLFVSIPVRVLGVLELVMIKSASIFML